MTKPIQIFLYIVIFTIIFIPIWSVLIEPSLLITKNKTLIIEKWHKEHEELKIGILSDIHAGSPHISLKKLQSITNKMNKNNPDIILILGDFIAHVFGGKIIEPKLIMDNLKELKARKGVFVVLGNHDWAYNGEKVIKAIKEVGFIVLEDKSIKIEEKGKNFWLTGISDLWLRRPDVKKVLNKIKDNDPIIVITHNPEIIPKVTENVSITLAGHTHGGQINLPIIKKRALARVGTTFSKGYYKVNGKNMYITSGIGTSVYPIRFGVIPEIVILRLKSKN